MGLIIYSDPADDGYVRGDVYPEGPMRGETGVQRGSVMNDNGDPSTPGYPSHPGAKRIPLSEMQVPHIPVIPVSYKNAGALLRGVRGATIPQPWQGGLPFRYHAGPGPVAARIVVRSDSATNAIKHIYDTFGIVRGSEFPDEIVIVGGHRDAWGPGAGDNVSGTVSILEAARAVAAEVKKGWKPKRTILFATWDAEEWGLLGSTEYVEDDSLRLQHGARRVSQSGWRRRRPALRRGRIAIASPDCSAMWRREVRRSQRRRLDLRRVAKVGIGGRQRRARRWMIPAAARTSPASTTILGIPIAEWGYHGRGGMYHSQFDSYHWMSDVRRPDVRLPRRGGPRRDGDDAPPRGRGRSSRTTTPSSRATCARTCATTLKTATDEEVDARSLRAQRVDRRARARGDRRSTRRATRCSRRAHHRRR